MKSFVKLKERKLLFKDTYKYADNTQLFEDILLELSYRSDEGYPDFSKPEHITILSEILTEWGMTDVKYELIKNLLKEDEEEDKKYFGIGGNTYVKKTDVDSKGKPKPNVKRFTKDDSVITKQLRIKMERKVKKNQILK